MIPKPDPFNEKIEEQIQKIKDKIEIKLVLEKK